MENQYNNEENKTEENQLEYYYSFGNQMPPQASQPRNPLATASLVLGICSLALAVTGMSFVLAAIGIVLALLSRGAAPMPRNAKAGLITSCIGGILSIVILIFSVFYVVQSGNLDKILDMYEQYYNSSTNNLYDNSGSNSYSNGYNSYNNGSDNDYDYYGDDSNNYGSYFGGSDDSTYGSDGSDSYSNGYFDYYGGLFGNGGDNSSNSQSSGMDDL